MRSIVTLALKDLRLLSRDRLGLFFIVVFPVIMGVAFGLIGASFQPGSSSSSAMKVGVVDEDHSAMSRLFIKSLSETGTVAVRSHPRNEAVDLVRKGKLVGFIAIPKGFGETAGIFWADAPAIDVGVDPSRALESGLLQGMIMQAMGKLVQYRFTHPEGMQKHLRDSIRKVGADKRIPATRRALLKGFLASAEALIGSIRNVWGPADARHGQPGPTMELARINAVDIRRPPTKQGEPLRRLRSPWDISFPAAIMWGVMACVAGFAVSVVKERTEGTYLRLQIAPISRTQILAGKAVACFAGCLGVIAMMMVLGLILGIQLARPWLLVLAAVCIASSFVGLMMLMSVIGRSEQAVAGAAWAIIVTLCLLGGGMMPLAFMPPFMKTLSHFSPIKWAILALEGAVWRDFSLSEMLGPCGVLLVVGAGCFAAGAAILSRQDG